MPGFELIGKEEKEEVIDIFEKSNVLFRHSFENIRNSIFKVEEFENNFSKKFGGGYTLAVSSGTAALKIALESLGIEEGEEVITQAFTFVATVEAIIECRANPIICEIDESLNLDPLKLESLITNKTKAIIVVHMLGVPCDMKPILKISKKYNIKVIEDTAWGCGGKYNDKFLGTIGDIGTFSFDFAKIITTGEGGMILTSDKSIYEKSKAYHDHGHENNPNLPRWKDSRSSSGFNYRMTELQGAVGIAQLKKIDKIILEQDRVSNSVKELLIKYNYSLRKVPKNSKETNDAVVFFAENSEKANYVRKKLVESGIGTKILPEAITWHFAGEWNHIKELKRKYSNLENEFKNSRSLLQKAIAIPINLKNKETFLFALEKTLKKLQQ